MKKTVQLFIAIILCANVMAQDPHYTQFNAVPLSVNPAYTGNFEEDIRVAGNFRQQWISSVAPISTTSIQADGKIGYENSSKQRPISFGILFMNDNSMKGAFVSNYISAAASYQITLDKKENQKLSIGLLASYCNRRLDFSNVSFQQQFASGGYDLTLPNGESALSNMKAYGSMSTGLLYNATNIKKTSNFDFGVSIFHINTPKQTVLKDDKQFLPMRFSLQSNFYRKLENRYTAGINLLYQSQASVNYLLMGASIASKYGDEENNKIGLGFWYRTKDAASPYLFIDYKKAHIGLSYDITTSELKNGAKPLKSFELSLQWKGFRKSKYFKNYLK